MFAIDCPHCGRVLLSTRAIRALRPSPLGLEVAYRCACGRTGEHLTGRRRVAVAAAMRDREPATGS